MFGTKIRSWMEAHIVRPRKKQHRKDGTAKKRCENGTGKDVIEPMQTLHPDSHSATVIRRTIITSSTPESTMLVTDHSNKNTLSSDQMRTQFQHQQNSNNLSSPESAYSTGYSTDGTSPGTTFPSAPPAPEYYINIRTGTRYFHSMSSDVPLKLLLPALSPQKQPKNVIQAITDASSIEQPPTINGRIISPATSSPRQRNRIRTNPWVTTNNVECNCSPMHVAVTPRPPVPTQLQSTTVTNAKPQILAATASPIRRKWGCADKKQRCMKCGACSRFEAFSSSSSSSLSVSSVHRATARQSIPSDDEDDRTLNEMMGKYDESYVYEKETDILSDSDPTDCDEDYDEIDIDAGRDGGDERDPLTDEDFDFIDTGSLEFNIQDTDATFVNMGHCTYHNFHEEQQSINRRRDCSNKASCYRKSNYGTPTATRRRRTGERRSKHVSSKKKRERQAPSSTFTDHQLPLPPILARTRFFPGQLDGSRSAGATPVSVRRRKAAISEQVSTAWTSKSVDKPRRNSVSYSRRSVRKQSGDTKLYEGDKEADKKYRELIIEAEHILMAMRTSSPPVCVSPVRRNTVGPANKRVELLRNQECGTNTVCNNTIVDVIKSSQNTACLSTDVVGTLKFSPKKNHITNFINNNAPGSVAIPGPPRGKLVGQNSNSPRHAPLLAFKPALVDLNRHCPQSEPVKRKVYAPATATNDIHPRPTLGRPLFHGIDNGSIETALVTNQASSPVFHRQKLFHTITHLKKNLETQSETLRHAYHYGSNQRL